MMKVPSEIVIRIVPGMAEAKIYANNTLLLESDAELWPKLMPRTSNLWEFELREKYTGNHRKDETGENEELEQFINCLRQMSDKSKELFGEIAYLLAEMQNLHSGDE